MKQTFTRNYNNR